MQKMVEMLTDVAASMRPLDSFESATLRMSRLSWRIYAQLQVLLGGYGILSAYVDVEAGGLVGLVLKAFTACMPTVDTKRDDNSTVDTENF